MKQKAEVLVTDPRYGYPPSKKPISILMKTGFINLDKPPGPTSHEVAAWVKRIMNSEKVGHGGTLDPMVTGVLPVAINKGVKVLRYLLTGGKEYVGVMRLHGDVKPDDVRNACRELVGRIYQRPPVRSSVKRTVRIRNVYRFDCLDFNGQHVLFKVECEAGTYVRKLVNDVGYILGCGAHMVELRRTRVALLTEKTAFTLQEVVDAVKLWEETGKEEYIRRVVRPIEEAVLHLPAVVVRDSAVDAICHGASVTVPGIVALDDFEKDTDVRILSIKGELIGIGKALMNSEQIFRENYGLAIKTDVVVMDPNTYPPMWKDNKK